MTKTMKISRPLAYWLRHQRERCDCGGYWFPHRRAGGACWHNPRWTQLLGDDRAAGAVLMARAGVLEVTLDLEQLPQLRDAA